MKKFDYIIVGAGSAGCVLANRLGKNLAVKILILEAGPMDYNLLIHVPAGVYSVYKDPKINWNYKTEAENFALNRSIDTPRGKVIGGSSSINSMVYMRGHPLDYDAWKDKFGLKDWSFDQCLPYFKAGESSDRGGDDWRGDSGDLGVSKGSFQNPLFDAFEEAGKDSGQGHSDDLNGFNPEGVARLDATKKNGRRCSAAVAHLRPALARGNVKLITRAHVEKIIFSGTTAQAITYRHKGKLHTIDAEKEIILSGGAINSPHISMLSGVGPSDHLLKHGITPVIDLPGVGQNLQDHAKIELQYECKKSFAIQKVDLSINKLAAGIQWIFTRTGIAASNIWEAGGLIKSNDKVPYPDLQYHFAPIGYEYKGTKIYLRQAFALLIDQLRPKSTGSVELKSSNPNDKPLINFNYLKDPKDIKDLVNGVKKARELVAQKSFDQFRGTEIEPGPSIKTDAEIKAWLRKTVATDYHPSCTCSMGNGKQAVVDENFCVHGLKNLRVVDASVMPKIISANLNAPVQMIAARAADMILGYNQKEPLKVSFAFEE